ncbi:universal stress protein [Tropicimonas sp. IMCC34043]|uniref:universal stress protein n=1 Tax=Tropicimonas sp. IMCC34043 TaxID=2248760 RepID=UPI000E2832FE|nr:universal stress protein [Tropicimonas sp. IMCC34043]
MFKRLLVPLAFEEGHDPTPALELAQRLAADQPEIVLLHVVEPVPPYAIHYIPEDLVAATRDGVRAELDRLAAGLTGGRGELVEGHPGRAILETAEALGTDCIVISGHRPGVQDFLLGSTAAHVVRHAPCSVMVLR